MEQEEQKKSDSRSLSIYEGSAYSIMDGFGFKYISPYALALGAGNTLVGLLSTLPGLLGNLSQLISIKLLKKYERKKIIVKSVFIQFMFWIPLIITGILYLYGKINSIVASLFLLIFYSIIIGAGSFGAPIWNSWMRDLVPEKSGDYFGKRGAITGAIALVSMIIAGFILDLFSNAGKAIIGFSILFTIALMGRTISYILMKKQYEPKYMHDDSKYFSFKEFVKKMSSNNFGRFVLFTTFFGFGVAISSPFFSVYMLKDLGFDKIYIAFSIVTLTPIFAALISSKFWGKAIDKYGNIAIIKINAFFISFVPIIWMVSYFLIGKSTLLLVSYLVIIEIFSGVVWAGYNLACGVFIYEAVTKQRMAICYTYNNITTSIGSFLGAMLGALLINYNLGFHPIIFIFVISFIFRLFSLLIYHSKINEVREVKKINIEIIEKIKGYLKQDSLTDSGVEGPNTSD